MSALCLILAQLQCPWGTIGQATESMGGTFLCHIPSLGESVSWMDQRLGARTQVEVEELGMICLVTGGLCVDRWSETSHSVYYSLLAKVSQHVSVPKSLEGISRSTWSLLERKLWFLPSDSHAIKTKTAISKYSIENKSTWTP